MSKAMLRNISPMAYEHPADRAALSSLRSIPGFDFSLRKLFGYVGDRSLRYATLASAVRVSEDQYSDLYRLYSEACQVLDIYPYPELYVSQAPFVNAGAVGIDKPFIVLNSGTLGLMDDDEVQYILGHELGHVLSEHVLYKTMIRLLLRISIVAMSVPLSGTAMIVIIAALLEWDRKSELSADRAGLLVVQDPEIVYSALMKMAGGGDIDQMSVDAFIAQAHEYSEGGVVDGIVKLFNLLGATHPFPVLRLTEIRDWVASGSYQEILDGDYPHRSDNGLIDDIKSGGDVYGKKLRSGYKYLSESIVSRFRG